MAEFTIPGPKPAIVSEAEYEQLFRSTGVDGAIGTPADSAIVYANGTSMHVWIRANKKVWIRGSLWQSGDTDFSLPIESNSSGQTRVDLVVIRLDRSTWETTAEVVQGTPGAGPPSATKDEGTSGEWELEIARVTVPNAAGVIQASNVARREVYVGEQPIVCTSGTRPPAKPFRVIGETDTGRILWSINNAWRAVVLSDSLDAISITISGSTPSGSPTQGRVWLRPTS